MNAIGQYLVGESYVTKKTLVARFHARAPLDPAASNESFVHEIARSNFFQLFWSPNDEKHGFSFQLKHCLFIIDF